MKRGCFDVPSLEEGTSVCRRRVSLWRRRPVSHSSCKGWLMMGIETARQNAKLHRVWRERRWKRETGHLA